MPSIPDTDLTRASGPEVLSAPGGFFDGMQIKFLKLVERINRSQYRNDRTVILESGGPVVHWSPRDQIALLKWCFRRFSEKVTCLNVPMLLRA